MSDSVRIINSIRGSGFTSAKNAAKYVSRGMAAWDGKAIRMIETDYRFNSAPARPKAVVHPPVLEVDTREFITDFSFWDGRGCLRFWKDQRSMVYGAS